MRYRLILTVALLICWSLGVVAVAQRGDLLDLTKRRTVGDKTRGGTGSGALGGMEGEKLGVLPVRLAFTNIDKGQYHVGDRFVYQVALQNVGNDPLLIPWNLEWGLGCINRFSNLPGELSLRVHIVLDELEGHIFFGADSVSGCRSKPLTVRRLLPGEAVRIQVLGGWWFPTEDAKKRALAMLPRRFTARVVMVLAGC